MRIDQNESSRLHLSLLEISGEMKHQLIIALYVIILLTNCFHCRIRPLVLNVLVVKPCTGLSTSSLKTKSSHKSGGNVLIRNVNDGRLHHSLSIVAARNILELRPRDIKVLLVDLDNHRLSLPTTCSTMSNCISGILNAECMSTQCHIYALWRTGDGLKSE